MHPYFHAYGNTHTNLLKYHFKIMIISRFYLLSFRPFWLRCRDNNSNLWQCDLRVAIVCWSNIMVWSHEPRAACTQYHAHLTIALRLSDMHFNSSRPRAPVNQAIFGSDNGLAPARHQAIFWTKRWRIFDWKIGNEFQLNLNHDTIYTKMHLKMAFAKWQTRCVVTLKHD